MRSLKHLPELLRPYWPHTTATLLLLVTTTGAWLIVPEIIQRVIDTGLDSGQVQVLFGYGLAVIGIGLARAGFTFLQRYLSEWIAHHVAYDLRNRLYDHIQHLSFSYHDHAQTGQLISRCIEDVRSIQRFTGFGVVEFLRTVFLLGGVVFILFFNQPQLAWITILPMLLLVLTTTRFGARISNLFLAVDQALGELSSRLQENVIGAPVVRAFAREPFEIERFDAANRDLYDARISVVGEWSKIMPTTRLMIAGSTMLLLWFGGGMVFREELSIGELVAFNSYLLLIAQPAQQLAWLVNLAGEAAAGLGRIFQVLDQEPDIQSRPQAISLPKLAGRVEFRDVSVRYAEGTEYALRKANLIAEPNQIIALIGATGSGKSTLVNLIPRFYEVSSGEVLVDGIDVRDADLVSLRRQIGIVPQTSLLFSVSIEENIAYGRPNASKDEIHAAAIAAQAHEFIDQLSDGYQTIVGERGLTLSGGQRQRIAIARALLLDPRILILDDSTSSVDIETERAIQIALSHLMEGRTTFVIAQRLSTVRRADLILVLDGGKIAERGTHEELLQLNGLYRQIYELQLKDQEPILEEQSAKQPISLSHPPSD